MRAAFDTRFFASSIASEDADLRKWAKRYIENLRRDGNLGIIPSIVVYEFYSAQLRALGKVVAETRTRSLLCLNLEVVNLDVPIAIEAAKLRNKYAELPTGDAIIAATAISSSCEYVLTDDKHLKQIREIKTRWI
jgi:predicted nucleic acid-binding protein